MATPVAQQDVPADFPSCIFRNPQPFFYFHHIIDPSEATLTVEVIGPNLGFTFTHSRAKAEMPATKNWHMLDRKTVGFLALVRGQHRHVLAWAESGHGLSSRGDFLDAPARGPVLANPLWTRRVVHLGTLLGLNMATLFDSMGRAGDPGPSKDHLRGIFLGSHVEVKLAASAVYLMLETFSITTDLDSVGLHHLERLRDVRWDDGTRPAFEVYFSRRNCAPCGNLVKALEQVTGMAIALRWADRLETKTYAGRTRSKAELMATCPTSAAASTEIDQVIVIEDHDDVITVDSSSSDDDDDDTVAVDSSDGDEPIDLVSPPASSAHEARRATELADYIRMLREYAHKVDASPCPVVPSLRVSTGVGRTSEEILIRGMVDKPLPATPVSEDPFRESPNGTTSPPWRRQSAYRRTSSTRRSASTLSRQRIGRRTTSPARGSAGRRRSPRPYALRFLDKNAAYNTAGQGLADQSAGETERPDQGELDGTGMAPVGVAATETRSCSPPSPFAF